MAEHDSEAISIRPARQADAEALASLVGELGYSTTAATARERLNALTEAGDCILVAVDQAKAIALVVLHRTRFLHRPADGRISTLVVSDEYRGRGIGGRLLEAAEAIFRQWGCERIEVSSGAQREAAHRFYIRAGYSEQPKRFIKLLA
ncbi:MAG TPA: GNAT family N-acetyltransferase [Blastocatellia bacterium]|nr:GNAT family N-acetyltransferase [Blastocatellia bacterium]